MRKIKQAIACGLFLLFALPCASRAQPAVDKYESPAAIPQALRLLLEKDPGGTEDHFAAFALATLPFPAEGLTAVDVKRLYAAEDLQRRQLHAEQLAKTYDINHDNSISAAEVMTTVKKILTESAQEDAPEYYSVMFDRVMVDDTNKDKVISAGEMLAVPITADLLGYVPKGIKSPAYHAALLKLDPDGDGKLTGAELDRLARKAFHTLDRDRNGLLAFAEKDILQQRKKSEIALDSPCRMEAPDADARIVYIGSQSGHGLSQYTVAGPYVDTGVAPVEIAPDAGKVHVIVSSMNPVIWAFSGETSLVSGVSVFGDVMHGQDKIFAGVTGIPPEKIHFSSSAYCLKGEYDRPEDDDDGAVQASLALMFGREADIMGGSQYLRRARISRSSISFEPVPDCIAMKVFDPPIPPGFDPDTWFQAAMNNEDRRFHDLSGMKVVSPAPVETYAVLPGWAGIAQLVYDGTIIREGTQKWQGSLCNSINHAGPMMVRPIESGGTYKIVKNIPYFPATETATPHYVIAKGIKLPKGFISSCVTAESTGKVLRGAADCSERSGSHR